MNSTAVIRTPHPSDALVDTVHWLCDSLQFLTARISQKLGLLQYLVLLQIPHADGFLSAIDVVPYYNWMLSWPRGDGHFDLRVCGSEFCEAAAEERTRTGRLNAIMEQSHGIRLTSCLLSFQPNRSSGSQVFCIGGRRRRRHSVKD
jgi:hypothetical protein